MDGPIEWWAGNPSRAQTWKLASILVMVWVSGRMAAVHPALSTISVVDDDVVLHGVVIVAGVFARVAQDRCDTTRALGGAACRRDAHGHLQHHVGTAVAGRALGTNDHNLVAARRYAVDGELAHAAVRDVVADVDSVDAHKRIGHDARIAGNRLAVGNAGGVVDTR